MLKIIAMLFMFVGLLPSGLMAQQEAKAEDDPCEGVPALGCEEQETTSQKEAASQIAEGTLARVDAEKQLIWLKTSEGKEMQFSYNQDTLVEGAGETVEGLAKEMSGNNLKIHYRTEGETNLASRIEIQRGEAEAQSGETEAHPSAIEAQPSESEELPQKPK